MTLRDRFEALRFAGDAGTDETILEFALMLRDALRTAGEWIELDRYSEPIEFSEAHGNLVRLHTEFAAACSEVGVEPAVEVLLNELDSLASVLNQHHVLVEDLRGPLDMLRSRSMQGASPFHRMAAVRELRRLHPQNSSLPQDILALEQEMANWWIDERRTMTERVEAKAALPDYSPITETLDAAYRMQSRRTRDSNRQEAVDRVIAAISEADAADGERFMPLAEAAVSLIEGGLAQGVLPSDRDWHAELERLIQQIDSRQRSEAQKASLGQAIADVEQSLASQASLSQIARRMARATDMGATLPTHVIQQYEARLEERRRFRHRVLIGIMAAILLTGVLGSIWTVLQWQQAAKARAVEAARSQEEEKSRIRQVVQQTIDKFEQLADEVNRRTRSANEAFSLIQTRLDTALTSIGTDGEARTEIEESADQSRKKIEEMVKREQAQFREESRRVREDADRILQNVLQDWPGTPSNPSQDPTSWARTASRLTAPIDNTTNVLQRSGNLKHLAEWKELDELRRRLVKKRDEANAAATRGGQ
jgi:hypothetical protein